MKKLFIPALLSAIVFSSCSGNSSKSTPGTDSTAQKSTNDQPVTTATKKYDLKSGIVHLETTIKAGGMNIVKKKILYFDDYGNKEAEETLNDGGTVEQTLLSDGKDLILLIPAKKESYLQGKAYSGTAMRYDREGMESAGKGKKVANITVAGKDCDAYEYNDDRTKTKNTFAGYKHILLYMKQEGPASSTTQATKVEEDAPVPAEKFTIPAGYTAKSM